MNRISDKYMYSCLLFFPFLVPASVSLSRRHHHHFNFSFLYVCHSSFSFSWVRESERCVDPRSPRPYSLLSLSLSFSLCCCCCCWWCGCSYFIFFHLSSSHAAVVVRFSSSCCVAFPLLVIPTLPLSLFPFFLLLLLLTSHSLCQLLFHTQYVSSIHNCFAPFLLFSLDQINLGILSFLFLVSLKHTYSSQSSTRYR